MAGDRSIQTLSRRSDSLRERLQRAPRSADPHSHWLAVGVRSSSLLKVAFNVGSGRARERTRPAGRAAPFPLPPLPLLRLPDGARSQLRGSSVTPGEARPRGPRLRGGLFLREASAGHVAPRPDPTPATRRGEEPPPPRPPPPFVLGAFPPGPRKSEEVRGSPRKPRV